VDYLCIYLLYRYIRAEGEYPCCRRFRQWNHRILFFAWLAVDGLQLLATFGLANWWGWSSSYVI